MAKTNAISQNDLLFEKKTDVNQMGAELFCIHCHVLYKLWIVIRCFTISPTPLKIQVCHMESIPPKVRNDIES